MELNEIRCAVLIWGLFCSIVIYGEMRRVIRFSLSRGDRKQRKEKSNIIEKLTLSNYRDVLPKIMYWWYYVQIFATLLVFGLLCVRVYWINKEQLQNIIFKCFFWSSTLLILLYFFLSGNFFRDKDTPPRWMKK